MSSVDIFEKSWIDLVFEGKNKAYGAYQLRRQSSRTTLSAFCYGILLIGGIAGIFTLSGFLNPVIAPPVGPDVIIRPVALKPRIPEPIKPKAQPTKQPQAPKDNLPPVIVPKSEADPDTPKPEAPSTPATPASNGTGTNVSPTIPAGTPTGTETKIPDGPVSATSLDKLPEFPGGISRFYTYVGNNFGKTDIGDEKTIRIYVSFVIEKNGSMTDIRVPRDPGFGLGNEAVRVLKSLKTKWAPGMIAGQPVRTAYSLPITVKTE